MSHSHRFNEAAAESGVSDELPSMAHNYKDYCGSTALVTPKSKEKNGQMYWQVQQTSWLIYSLAWKKCLEAWGTFWTWINLSITGLMAWSKEEWRKKVTNVPPWEVKSNLCSTTAALVHWYSLRSHLGETTERQKGVWMGNFLALQCHLSGNRKMKKMETSHSYVSIKKTLLIVYCWRSKSSGTEEAKRFDAKGWNLSVLWWDMNDRLVGSDVTDTVSWNWKKI